LVTPAHAGLAALAALFWGATYVISDLALETTPPLLFAALRFFFAALFIVVVPKPPVRWRILILGGLLHFAIPFGLIFIALDRGMPPGMTSLLVHIQAFFTIGIAMLMFGERLSRRDVLAALLGAFGLGLLIIERDGGLGILGPALILVAAVSVAGGNTVLKSLGKVDMLAVAVWMSLAATLPLFVLSLIFEGPAIIAATIAAPSWTLVGALAYSALFSSIAAVAIWGRLLTTYPAASIAPYFLLVPVFGIALAVLVVGESFTAQRVAGGALIFAGLAAATLRRKGAAVTRRG
jgi:O-acetylserine/cysteine efflux transporter